MADKDVTGLAATMAGEKLAKVMRLLKVQLFAGPNNVRLTKDEALDESYRGNVDAVRQAMQTMDEAQQRRSFDA